MTRIQNPSGQARCARVCRNEARIAVKPGVVAKHGEHTACALGLLFSHASRLRPCQRAMNTASKHRHTATHRCKRAELRNGCSLCVQAGTDQCAQALCFQHSVLPEPPNYPSGPEGRINRYRCCEALDKLIRHICCQRTTMRVHVCARTCVVATHSHVVPAFVFGSIPRGRSCRNS